MPFAGSGGSATKRRRVVVDTGVAVTAFAFGGLPARALRALIAADDVCVSSDLLAEYRQVPAALRASGKITTGQFQALVAGIAIFVTDAVLVEPKRSIRACRDPKDDMVLECCLAARATILITGDRDLLDLDVSAIPGLRRLRIVKPRTYIDSLA